jgi:hypothetical protein
MDGSRKRRCYIRGTVPLLDRVQVGLAYEESRSVFNASATETSANACARAIRSVVVN